MNKYNINQQICFFDESYKTNYFDKKIELGIIKKIFERDGIIKYFVNNSFKGDKEKDFTVSEKNIISICNNDREFQADKIRIKTFLQKQKKNKITL